jgi:hypothetical protein
VKDSGANSSTRMVSPTKYAANDRRESTCCGDMGGLWGVRGSLWSGLRRYGGRSCDKRRGKGDLTRQLLLEEALGLTMTKARAEVTFRAISLVLQSGIWCGDEDGKGEVEVA